MGTLIPMTDFFTRPARIERTFREEGERIVYAKNQHLVWNKDESAYVFFMADGIAHAHFATADGTKRIIGYFVPGMTFAKKESFWGTVDETLSFTTDVPTTIYRLKRTNFLQHLSTDQSFATEYTAQLLRMQVFYLDHIVSLGEKTLYLKCVRWLLLMAKCYGDGVNERIVINIPLTQDAIAGLLQTTRESTNVTLKELTAQGLIIMEHKHITIPNVTKLQKLLK